MGRTRIHLGDSKFTLRIYTPLLRRIEADAKSQGLSANTLITKHLAKLYPNLPSTTEERTQEPPGNDQDNQQKANIQQSPEPT